MCTKTRPHYDKLDDVPAELLAKYERGQYVFSPPPVCHRFWDKLAWINYVTFTRLTEADLQVETRS